MKNNKFISGFLLTLCLIFSSCGVNGNKKELFVESLPSKTTYQVGERFLSYGLVVVDKTTKEIIDDYDTSIDAGYVFKNEDIGEYKITVSKKDYLSTDFSVTVTEKHYDYKLEIKQLPSITQYEVGDAFSLKGLVVYDTLTGKETTSYKSSLLEGYIFRTTDVGTKTIVLSMDNHESVSFEIEVIVSKEALLKIEKEKVHDELFDYYYSFNFALYDENGGSALNDIFDRYDTNIKEATSVEQVHSLLEEAKEALDNVPLNVQISGLSIISYPSRRIYTVGDKLDLLGLDIGVILSDSSIKKVKNYKIDDVDMSKPNKNITVTIRFGGHTASFDIEVKEKETSGIKRFSIFATNDIHGQVERQSSRASIAKLGTYLKEKSDLDNTLLLDQGDTWQGSIYSNYNHGALLTDIMNYVRYDARTVGNHDFDWGVGYIEDNTERSYEGYKTPVLAANVYDYNFETKSIGSHQQKEIGAKTISYTLENGLKVGIVGTIGFNQITTINSLYTQYIAFSDHIETIKQEASILKEEGCDFIISCCHAGQEDLIGYGLDKYVDLVLCAHTHKEENYTENGLYYAQYGAYNQYVGHLEIAYDLDNHTFTYETKEVISGYQIESNVRTIDSEINKILDKYNSECEEAASEIVANNVSGSFYSSEQLPNLMCKVMYDEATSEGYSIDLAYCNSARASLYSSTWTYADLYQAFPFDNEIFIIEVSYNEMIREIGSYNYVYRSPSFDGVLSKDKTYRVAVIDFLVFHTNSMRYYDYFPDNNGKFLGVLENNYRICFKEWLIENRYNQGQLLSSENYSSSLISFSRQFTY